MRVADLPPRVFALALLIATVMRGSGASSHLPYQKPNYGLPPGCSDWDADVLDDLELGRVFWGTGAVSWCRGSCGLACEDVCKEYHSEWSEDRKNPPTWQDVQPLALSDAQWFALQDTTEKCQRIARAISTTGDDNVAALGDVDVVMTDDNDACVSDTWGNHTPKLLRDGREVATVRAPLSCSTNSACASAQRATEAPFCSQPGVCPCRTNSLSNGSDSAFDTRLQYCPCVFRPVGLDIYGAQVLAGVALLPLLVAVARFAPRCIPKHMQTVGRVVAQFSTSEGSSISRWSWVHFVTRGNPSGFLLECVGHAPKTRGFGALGSDDPAFLMPGELLSFGFHATAGSQDMHDRFSLSRIRDFKYCPAGNKILVSYVAHGRWFCRAAPADDDLKSRYSAGEYWGVDLLVALLAIGGGIAFIFVEMFVNTAAQDPEMSSGKLVAASVITAAIPLPLMALLCWRNVLVERTEVDFQRVLDHNNKPDQSEISDQTAESSDGRTKHARKEAAKRRRRAKVEKMAFGAEVDSVSVSIDEIESDVELAHVDQSCKAKRSRSRRKHSGKRRDQSNSSS
jgi:hypothetical protein